ncbi:MAG: hypothetical protein ACYDGR_07730 [Candidatus Dormibacteria bacterium]
MAAKGFPSGFKVEHALWVIGVGTVVMVIQDLLKDDAESWLKGHGWWV